MKCDSIDFIISSIAYQPPRTGNVEALQWRQRKKNEGKREQLHREWDILPEMNMNTTRKQLRNVYGSSVKKITSINSCMNNCLVLYTAHENHIILHLDHLMLGEIVKGPWFLYQQRQRGKSTRRAVKYSDQIHLSSTQQSPKN